MRVVHWLVPGVGLALILKCPACLAAYIALGTGVAVSFPVAAVPRMSLLIVCVGSLVWLAARQFGRRGSGSARE
jgi:hypothetical protein